MPESKGRKEAVVKKKQARQHEVAEGRVDRQRRQPSLGTRGWVVPTFVTLGLIGVLWLIVWYVTTATGVPIPFMAALGGWNMLIGMGLMAAAFGVSTLWK